MAAFVYGLLLHNHFRASTAARSIGNPAPALYEADVMSIAEWNNDDIYGKYQFVKLK